MDRTDVGRIATFLLDCEKALYRWDGTESMTVYLGQLYQAIHRMRGAIPDKTNRDMRFCLAIAMRKALRLRRKIEERLGIRN